MSEHCEGKRASDEKERVKAETLAWQAELIVRSTQGKTQFTVIHYP
jgi:hypothetical protein